MKRTVHFFLFYFLIISFTLGIGAYSIIQQQIKKESSLITKHIKSIILENAYLIKTEVSSTEDLINLQSKFIRQAAMDSLIKAILITQGEKFLLNTLPPYQSLPHNLLPFKDFNSLEPLIKTHYIYYSFPFFDRGESKSIKLIVEADITEIQAQIEIEKASYLSLLLTPTAVAMLIFYLLTHVRIIKPLEQLRQFAYYQSLTPSKMNIIELEAIRSSLKQTFDRLDKEKKALYNAARQDALCGLPNRNYLQERINWLISESSRCNKEFAFLFVDLDNFKKVNDTLGHDTGDELLVNVANMIQQTLKKYDTVARVGGDEFIVILTEYHSNLQLNNIIQRLLEDLGKEATINTYPISLSASIGVSFFPKDGDTMNELMKNADIAMYQAKKSGKNQAHYFTEDLNQKISEEVRIENLLCQSLKEEHFKIYYQPKVNVSTNKIIGAEALLRLNLPTGESLSPEAFIPIAESSRFINYLGDWVIRTALLQVQQWQALGHNIPIAINASSVQFQNRDFLTNFKKYLMEFNVNPNNIEIEITESVLLEKGLNGAEVLDEIKKLGCHISLDDFGTGYSSLSYLKDLPIDKLKIDKSFMDEFTNTSGKVFIETIINMGHTLKLSIVAEGVETQEQLDFLKTVNCDLYQGYFCSQAIPAEEFLKKFKKHCDQV
jgi:diguanylate cyclase (GGDEF)-like protein